MSPEPIIVAQNGRHYVYCSVHDPSSSGTVIDFAQNVIERGCSLGRARQLLRPFLNGGYVSDLRVSRRGRYVENIRPSQPDLLAVAARYAKFSPVAGHHPYLCDERGIAPELLADDRVRDRLRHCPLRGSVIFPHWGSPDDSGGTERCLTGFEIKGRGVNMFSKGGRKGLWMSGGFDGDRVIAFAESGLDALSYLATRGTTGDVRVASLSGKMNPTQPDLVASAIARMGEGAYVVAAFDNDDGGDQLTEQLVGILGTLDRPDLEFKDDRPLTRGADWNRVLMENRHANDHQVGSLTPRFGR